MARLWLLAAVLALPCGAAWGQDTFGAAVSRYRADPKCFGASYDAAVSAVDISLTDYHVLDPAQAQASVAAGVMAAAQLDQLASAAAAKGCTAQALENWRQVIRSFDGPAFASFQRRAVAGIRGLRR